MQISFNHLPQVRLNFNQIVVDCVYFVDFDKRFQTSLRSLTKIGVDATMNIPSKVSPGWRGRAGATTERMNHTVTSWSRWSYCISLKYLLAVGAQRSVAMNFQKVVGGFESPREDPLNFISCDLIFLYLSWHVFSKERRSATRSLTGWSTIFAWIVLVRYLLLCSALISIKQEMIPPPILVDFSVARFPCRNRGHL